MTRPVITRFAPSPTGFLHIGGARTALFNWLYAKHTGGKMLLRIEDTDRERSTQAAVDAIKDGLRWLGLAWDGEAVSQFERAGRHRQIAHELVQQGKAYYCYMSAEELAALREEAKAQGRPPRYNGFWRDRDPGLAPKGVKPVIRIKAPQSGETLVRDRVQGVARFPNKDLDDFVILRSDGTPTYMLAVVADDHDMQVSHIIRGDDHLTNAARQIILYQALGWDAPVMAHIPLIHGADGAKLSKRHGALGVEAYRAMGYLPPALCNYLARLGWSHGNDEIMSMAEMIAWFDMEAINKGAARFDFKKLEAVNGYYMRHSDDKALLRQALALRPHLPAQGALPAALSAAQEAQFLQAMPGLKERSKTLVELLDNAGFIFAARPLDLEPKAQSLLGAAGKAALAAALPLLEQSQSWQAEDLHKLLQDFAAAKAIKLGELAQPLRAALTGRAVSPGVFDVLAVLGREESLARIKDQLAGTA